MADVKLTLLSRDALAQRYREAYKLRKPEVIVGADTEPFIRSEALADLVYPTISNASIISKNVTSSRKTGAALDDEAVRIGTKRLPTTGAQGFATVSAAVGGGLITDTDIGTIGSYRFRCAVTGIYQDGDPVPLLGVDTGPETNQDAGSTLVWAAPRAGIGSKATVQAQADGRGLTGGRDAEQDNELNDRLGTLRANPPANGNVAHYLKAVSETPGLSIEQAFVYPCVPGPSGVSICFTMPPSTVGGSRVPNAGQKALVLANLVRSFTDAIFVCDILEVLTRVELYVSWLKNGWTDLIPWPRRSYGAILTTVVTSAYSFRLNVLNASYVPTVGATFAFYDTTTKKFYRKRAASVTLVSGTTYTIVCDQTNGASSSFVPAVSAQVCPWSESLNLLVPAVLGYFDTLGPGEQATPLEDGLRQRRFPESPAEWPNVITSHLDDAVEALPEVSSVSTIVPTFPTTTAVGTPSASSNLRRLGAFCVFPPE